jgi:hypothetical protein
MIVKAGGTYSYHWVLNYNIMSVNYISIKKNFFLELQKMSAEGSSDFYMRADQKYLGQNLL